MAKDPRDPSTTSAAHDIMSARWRVIDTVLAGTEALRVAGRDFLPQHKHETNDDYQMRLEITVLKNQLEITLDQLAGKPFSEPVQPNDDVPKEMVDGILPDVDLQGNRLDVFCRQWFRAGLQKGFCPILVEYPKIEQKPDGKPRTLDDDRRENLRPYWQIINPGNVIYAFGEMVNGVERLTHVRLKELVKERDGYTDRLVEQIRVLEPGKVTLLRKGKVRGGKTQWLKHDEWATGLNYIPMVTFYTAREDVMLCKPPLLDLAYLNVTHWQSTSDQRNILTYARFPILALSGGESDGVVIGPNRLLHSSEKDSKYYFVEHGGTSIEAGRLDLKEIEEAMAAYGSQFLRKQPGSVTATARALDGAEALSSLQAMALVFQDAVAQALDMTADWMRIQGGVGGTVHMEVDFGVDEAAQDVKPALELRKNRDISRQAIVNLFKERGYLSEDFDADADALILSEEMADLAASMDLDPTGGQNAPQDSPAA